jgi:predicted DNA-binding WGR domain protein
MPRYEFSDGKSNKFWQIELSGNSFTTTYGRIGTDGQSTTKEWKSEEEASKQYEKLVAEKVGKGYKLVGGDE